VCSVFAGIFTFLFYWQLNEKIAAFGAEFAQNILGFSKTSVIDFVAGVSVLGLSFMIFTPIYLLSANYFGIIDEGEKRAVSGRWSAIRKIFKKSEPKTDHRPLTTDH
jgi:hypothetical protein